jgi:aspartyl-tRNA(Asn)/glutamyl-tRNA(Gln) amidotransferase subunit C
MDAVELHVTARMARLTLSNGEIDKLQQAIEQMLKYFSHLKSLDVENLMPTTHALAGDQGLRKDMESAGVSADLLLNNAPEREDRFIVIPNVL